MASSLYGYFVTGASFLEEVFLEHTRNFPGGLAPACTQGSGPVLQARSRQCFRTSFLTQRQVATRETRLGGSEFCLSSTETSMLTELAHLANVVF